MSLNVTDEYRLLAEFRNLFSGTAYLHRNSTQGDFVAMHLYEDLCSIDRSKKLLEAVRERKDRVLSVQNRRRGVLARRGDGTFGQLIPGEEPFFDPGYVVGRGPIATVEIGIEVKILAKAMIKQIDRVINDLKNQANQFRQGGGNPICVGLIGINHSDSYVSYERAQAWPTTGRGGYLHPIQEASRAEERLRQEAAPAYDEFVVLRFRATNVEPFSFEWVNYNDTRLDYAAALTRISSEYDRRF